MKCICNDCMNYPCTEDMSTLLKSCPAYSPKPKPQTNADRIRQMTDEELATLLNGAESDGRVYGPKGKVAWEKWLKQECDPNE